jgi:hypothetical protein
MEFEKLNRRDFLRLSGLTAAGVLATACGTPPAPGSDTAPAAGEAAATPAATAAAGDAAVAVADVARERTLITNLAAPPSGSHSTITPPLPTKRFRGWPKATPTTRISPS